jgi:hypothetical protein
MLRVIEDNNRRHHHQQGQTTTSAAPATRAVRRLPPLADGSTTAKALAAVWGGDPATVVESPPGAGKTVLVTTVAAHLAARAGLRVAIATQTNAQAFDLANRLATATNACPLTLLTRTDVKNRPAGLAPGVEWVKAAGKLSEGVVVATTARWQWITTATWRADLLIVDEAWQLTWADFGALAPVGLQVLLVGDPGQIAPVTTGDISRWRKYRVAPHKPAPEALMAAHPEHVTRMRLPSTWRLGPATTRLIQPLYGFGFKSTRPPSAFIMPGSDSPEPEVAAHTVLSHGGGDDAALADAIATRVHRAIGGRIRSADGTDRILADTDIGVVCAHVSQVTAVAARLTAHPGVMIDTTERHQGLEHEVVVLWLPLAGARTVSGFALDTGRLCVGLSRHRCHLTVITRHDTRALLDLAGPLVDAAATAKYQAVLDAIDQAGAGS